MATDSLSLSGSTRLSTADLVRWFKQASEQHYRGIGWFPRYLARRKGVALEFFTPNSDGPSAVFDKRAAFSVGS